MRDALAFLSDAVWQRRVLWSVGVAVGLILAVLCFVKYHLFLYDGIDLAYFSQVFWNFAHGRAWTQSIHPHVSLGDHAELIIPLLVPFFALWQDPRMLLLLQIVAVLAPAIPLYLVAQHVSRERLRGSVHPEYARVIPFLATLLYLLSPLVHNIALFEFHILSFTLLPLFIALLAYVRRDRWLFLLSAGLALLVREDVALVVFGFSLFAVAEYVLVRDRRERPDMWWMIVPAVMGVVWFFLAMRLIATFSLAGSYKFLVYYAWLGDSFAGIVRGIFLQPLAVISHIFSTGNLEMFLGFFMAVVFVPLFGGRRALIALLLCLGPLAQILLGAPGGSALVIKTHYAVLFLPALYLAVVYGLVGIFSSTSPRLTALRLMYSEHTTAFYVIALTTFLYSSAMLGPLNGAYQLLFSRNVWLEREIFAARIADVGASDSVVAGYRFLPHLAMRADIYSLHYVFLGVTQFGERPYVLPVAPDHVVIDSMDALRWQAQFAKSAWAAPYYADGYSRLRETLGTRAGVLQWPPSLDSKAEFLLGPLGTTEVRK